MTLPVPDFAVFSLDDRAGWVKTVTAPDPEAAAAQVQAKYPGATTSAVEMAKRLKTLRRIAETSPSPLRERLLRAVGLVAGLLRSGDLDRASAALPRLAEIAAQGATKRG